VVEGKLSALGFEQRLELAAEAWASRTARMPPRDVEGRLGIMDDAVTIAPTRSPKRACTPGERRSFRPAARA
jgi:hypothetical protein